MTFEFDMDLRGLDTNDLDARLRELGVLNEFGTHINAGEMSKLEGDNLLESAFTPRLVELRDASVFNFGSAGEAAAQQIDLIDFNMGGVNAS